MIIVTKRYNSDKEKYIDKYGLHFNEKLYKFALSLMCHANKTTNLTEDQILAMLERFKISLRLNHPYDVYYVANMSYHDFYKSSLKDEEHLALFMKDYLEDEDGYKGLPFCRWLTDMEYKSIEINWKDML